MSATEQLGRVSRLYSERAQSFEAVALAAAHAEADYRRLRAQAILRHKAQEERISQAEAETRADAEDTVAAAHLEKLTTAAVAEAHRERLRQLRSQVDVGRSYVTSERAADTLEARGSIP